MNEPFEIRYARPGDKEDVRALWDECFPDDGAFSAYFFDCLYRPERALLSVGPDGPASMLHMMPYEMAWLGRTVPVGYVYGVGTHPAFRRRGLAADLIDQALFEMHLRGQIFSVLIPQEECLFDFYRPFGYASVFETAAPRYEPADMPRKAGAGDIALLNRVYEAHMDTRPHLLRTPEHWADILRESALGGGQVLISGEAGYAVYAGGDAPVECFGPGAGTSGPPRLFGCLRVVEAARALAIWKEAGRATPPVALDDPFAPWNAAALPIREGAAVMGAAELAARLFTEDRPYMQLMHN